MTANGGADGGPGRKPEAAPGQRRADVAVPVRHETARHRRHAYRDRRGRERSYWQAYCEQCGQEFSRRSAQWEASLDARAHRNGWAAQNPGIAP